MTGKSLGWKTGILFVAALTLALAGCGTVQHELLLRNDYVPKTGSKIEVGLVSNDTGTTFDIPVEKMLKDALVDALREEDLAGNADPLDLVLNCSILSYKKGDAFKRWLWPGWGATELDVRCDLLDAGKNAGTVTALRTVTAGGAYTVGAWEQVFAHVASDIAEDVRGKFGPPRVKAQ